MDERLKGAGGGATWRELNADIMREQVKLAITQIPLMQSASVLVALILCFSVSVTVSRANIFVWLALVGCVAISRYFIYTRFQRELDAQFNAASWKRIYEISTLSSGLVWGASAFLVFPAGDQVMQSFFVLVMASLAVSTVISHSTIRSAPGLWAVPALLPFAIRFFWQGGAFGHSLSLLLILYSITVIGYSFKVNRSITESIRLRFKNIGLLAELRDANLLKDQFVTLVSHDLRSPVATIQSYANYSQGLLKEGAGAAQIDAVISAIAYSSESMLNLLDQLLNISRLKTGKIVPNCRTFDVWRLVEQQWEIVKPAAERKQVTLVNELPKGMLLLADRPLYGQVLNNLLMNAVKFSAGGSKIRVYSPSALCVAVEDRGVGIDPTIVPDIFRHEVKTSTSGTMGEKGTGLGLPLCMDIIRAHGGEIEVRSRPKEGSVFTIRLPLVRRSILLADDVEAHRSMMKQALNRLPEVGVADAENGQEALEELENAIPALIIADLNMPVMGGRALLEKVKNDPRFSNIPFVVMTAGTKTADGLRKEMMGLGAVDLITKPIDEESFLKTVMRFL